MRRIVLLLFLAFLLAACDGGEPTPANTGGNNVAEQEEVTNGEGEDTGENEDAEPVAEEEEATEEPAAEEEPTEDAEEVPAEEPAGEGDLLYEGIDPETGLEINPNPIPQGVEFIARGTVIQMNLTPQTAPEFVIRAPSGTSYRIATQGLADIFLVDGTQLRPFEYRNGMIAQATAFLPVGASLTDVLTSEDFTIIALP